MSDAVITKYEIVTEFNEETVVLPAAGVQVENQALLILQLTDITKSATVSIPAPKIAIFQDTSGPLLHTGVCLMVPRRRSVTGKWQPAYGAAIGATLPVKSINRHHIDFERQQTMLAFLIGE